MIFIDFENFKANIKWINQERRQNRIIDFHKINQFICEYLGGNEQFKKEKITHVRTYFYTGEYTDSILKRMRDTIENSTTEEEKTKATEYCEKTKAKKDRQRDFFDRLYRLYFFEVRKKPLQYTKEKGIFQKGVDVQIAVDLVTNAHLNNFDIAVIFSGDIDLLESLKTVKNLGKNVIIISHYKNIAKDMKKEADFFIDLQKMHDKVLDKFTHKFEEKENVISNNTITQSQKTITPKITETISPISKKLKNNKK